MRALLTVALAAMLAAGCGGSGGRSASAGCGRIDPPPGSLTTVPAGTPVLDVCALARRATDVVLASNDDATARRLVAAAPNIRVWQDREFQFGEPCDGCPTTPLPIDQIRSSHPEWILRDAAGNEITGTLSPGGERSSAMLDVGNVDYQGAWEDALSTSLMGAPWAGSVIQVNNDSDPSASGRGSRHGRRGDARRQGRRRRPGALARARGAEDRGILADRRHRRRWTHPCWARSAAPTRCVVPASGDWPTVLDYVAVAVNRDVGVWMDGGPPAPRSSRVFGYAAFLLGSAEPFSAYDPTSLNDPLFRVNLGKPLGPPEEHDGVWERTFEQGAVAVNAGTSPATVDLGSYGSRTLAPKRAVIATPNGTFT